MSTNESGPRCARCGRVLPFFGSDLAMPGELCSWCATGHGPSWQEYPEPDWWGGRALKRLIHRLRLDRFFFPGTKE